MRKLVSLLLGCLMVSLLTGCTLPQKDYCDSVSQSVEKCFEDVNSFPAVFSDSVFSVKYGKLSPAEQKLIACYVKCCSVDSVTQDETSMTVCVSVPSVKSLQSHFSFDDSSFSNEYKKLKTNGQPFKNDWYEYVEYGSTNELTIFLQRNGFERDTADYIKKHQDQYVVKVNGEYKLKSSILECDKQSVVDDIKDIAYNIPELFYR